MFPETWNFQYSSRTLPESRSCWLNSTREDASVGTHIGTEYVCLGSESLFGFMPGCISTRVPRLQAPDRSCQTSHRSATLNSTALGLHDTTVARHRQSADGSGTANNLLSSRDRRSASTWTANKNSGLLRKGTSVKEVTIKGFNTRLISTEANYQRCKSFGPWQGERKLLPCLNKITTEY
jgi:hypothetical protein